MTVKPWTHDEAKEGERVPINVHSPEEVGWALHAACDEIEKLKQRVYELEQKILLITRIG